METNLLQIQLSAAGQWAAVGMRKENNQSSSEHSQGCDRPPASRTSMFLYQLQGNNLETPIKDYLQIQFNVLEDENEQYNHVQPL